MSKNAANSKSSAKKRKPTPASWKHGQSGNPKGAPKRGQSWKEIIKQIGDLTPKEASDYCHTIAARIASIGNEVTLKEAVILRVYAALLYEPDARLLNVIIDRDEGKVTQEVSITIREKLQNAGLDADEITRQVEEWLHSDAARAEAEITAGESDAR